MKITARRVFTVIMLTGTFITTYQILSKPNPVSEPKTREAMQADAASFDQKMTQLGTPTTEGAPAEVHFTSDEVNAELAESTGALPAAGNTPVPASTASPAAGESGVQVKSYDVKLDGDLARGQFLTHMAGADVYVTLAGHLGSQDGYVTFDPTEFKVGDLSIPVSLLNPALQKKLVEQREQLRLPDGIGSLRVENGELVITQR